MKPISFLASYVKFHVGQNGGTVLDLRRGRCYHLNATASEILQRLSQGEQPTAIARQISKVHSVEESRANQDVAAFINLIKQRKWVVSSGNRSYGFRRFVQWLIK